MSELNVICKMKFGSHLYGTQTEKSDTDYKGVFLPPLKELVLQEVSKVWLDNTKKNSNTKNNPSDIDSEIYSLHYFLQLAYEGQTVALDMIHCPASLIVEGADNEHWRFIVDHRSKFYTKNLRSYIGYCRTQAAKYGVKGSRLKAAEDMIYWLALLSDPTRTLASVWQDIPTGEHIIKTEIPEATQEDKRALEICNRKFMATTPVRVVIDCIHKFYNNYGDRAKQAKENLGIDWKALSHAFRAGLQLKEIYETGDLEYPLKDAVFLRDIKQGKYHYQNDGIGEKLDNLINAVEKLADESRFPDRVDREFWKTWLIQDVYKLAR